MVAVAVVIGAGLGAGSASAQTITSIGGTGVYGYGGDGGPATAASFAFPIEVALDSAGNLFVSDMSNNRIRKIATDGTITTVVGNGVAGFSGDGGPATAASITRPIGIEVDAAGNLYFSDAGNHRIRKVTPAGVISTVAGNGTPGYGGDGGPATQASLFQPYDFAFDRNGNLFITDTQNMRIRKVTPDGIITTFAGTGVQGYTGDGGPATGATLSLPVGITFDRAGDLLFSDSGNNRVRKITPDGTITTIIGVGSTELFHGEYGGDDGPAIEAGVNNTGGLLFDPCGNFYVADFSDHRLRRVGTDGIINTIAGNGTPGFGGDGGPASASILNYPHGIALDPHGNLYFPDAGNHRIRKIALGACANVAASGFKPPVDNPPLVNVVQAGQTIPLKWQVADAAGNPVTLASVVLDVVAVDCASGAPSGAVDEITISAPDLLDHGGGNYQYQWRTPRGFKGSCRQLSLDLGDGNGPSASFRFK